MNFKHFAKLALTLAAFFGKDVTQVRLPTFVATRRVSFETLGSATVRLHFWHFKLQF
jgi:hypothetical protein